MAAIPFQSPIDLTKNEIQNVRAQNLASAPGSPVNGQFYYDTTLNKFGVYHNGDWEYLSAGVVNGVTKATNAVSAGVGQVSGGADKTLVDYAGGEGLVKSSATGVFSAAVAGTDYVTASSTNTFTNKTFDANGTGNSITNLETADFATNVIDTDTTLAANSNTRLASQAAVKAYIDNKVVGLLDYKGAIDASTNPNYPSALKGDYYKISVAGKIGGASGIDVAVGDAIIANADNAGGTQASVGTSWDIIQANVDNATTSTAGLTTYATSAEAEAKSLTTKSLTPASVVNFPVKKIFTIGDGSTTNIVVTHNLNTQDIIASVRAASGNQMVMVDITATSVNTATISFAVAPASNAYKVTIIG